MAFDPNQAAKDDSGIFGLPYDVNESALVILPVPWEATTSYGGGTSMGPSAILAASHQVDLFDLNVLRPYQAKLAMASESAEVIAWNREAKELAQAVIHAATTESENRVRANLTRVNELSARLNTWVKQETSAILKRGQIAAVLGGDHSVPLGAFHALGETGPFGILHIDAHSDTRRAYEGFTYSHASIMYNALTEVSAIKKIVQIGIRDFCEEEYEFTRSQGERVTTFYDRDLAQRRFAGEHFDSVAKDIVERLPKRVWVSFDIDGLDPRYCPHTGTPVPGGLDFQEVVHLLVQLARSGRTIVGFDLNEVAPNLSDEDDEWDANVGARVLYKLAALTLASQGKAAWMSP